MSLQPKLTRGISKSADITTPGALPWLALLTVWVVWGSTFLGIRAAVETIPPLLMAGTRFVIAGSLLGAFAAIRRPRDAPPLTRRHLRSTAIVGLLMLGGGNGTLCLGEKRLASGLASLIVATVPAWMVLINAAVTRTRVPWTVRVALALGIAGVGVLIGGPGGAIDLGGAALILVGTVFWATGSVYSRTAALPADPLVVTSLQMLAGGIALLVIGLAVGELHDLDLAAVSARSLLGFGWLVGFGSMVAFTAYVYANRTLPNNIVATYAYVNPIIAVALGTLLDGEAVTPKLLLGGAIIVASVVLIVRRPH